MGYYRIGTHLRLRPSSRPSPALHVDSATATLRVDLKHADGGPPRSHDDQMVFHFDSIIQSTSQEDTFNDCALDIVEDVLCGYNGTILAYGQSGSGKTFFMSGDVKNPLHKGVIPRAIQRVFADKTARPESEASIFVSYLEVYNEVIYDLLTDKKEPPRGVTLLEENGSIELRGLRQFHCETEDDALKYFLHGERRRLVGASTIHKASNRSHCMFTIYVERHMKLRDFPDRTAAKLNLVDLAGFERFRCIDPGRQSEKEVLNINKSLTFLEQAVSELRKGQGHVSFRQSKLTMLLRDGLGGNSKTVLLVCALQEHDFMDETISTLRFAQRVRDLKTSAVVNKVVDSVQAEREKYERKIAELKRELAFHDALNGRTGISRDDVTEQRKVELKSKVEAFLSQEEDVDAIPIESLAQIKETYYIFKEAQTLLHAKLEKLSKENSIAKIEENQTTAMVDDADGVGELEPQGIAVGVAPLDWRPAKMHTIVAKAGQDSDAKLQQSSNEGSSLYGDSKGRNLAFREFKHTVSEGIQLSYILSGRKSELKEKKLLMQNLSEKQNEYKRQIQDLSHLVEEQGSGLTNTEKLKADQTECTIEPQRRQERLQQAKEDYEKCFAEALQTKVEIQFVRKEVALTKIPQEYP